MREHVVLELRGYAISICRWLRGAFVGIDPNRPTRFADLNGKITVVIERVDGDKNVVVRAYQL